MKCHGTFKDCINMRGHSRFKFSTVNSGTGFMYGGGLLHLNTVYTGSCVIVKRIILLNGYF